MRDYSVLPSETIGGQKLYHEKVDTQILFVASELVSDQVSGRQAATLHVICQNADRRRYRVMRRK